MYKISWLLWVTVPKPNQREPGRCRPLPLANSLWLIPAGREERRRQWEGEVPGTGSDVSSQLGVCPDSWHGVGPRGWGRREWDGTEFGFASLRRGQSAGALNSEGRWTRTFGTSAGGFHPPGKGVWLLSGIGGKWHRCMVAAGYCSCSSLSPGRFPCPTHSYFPTGMDTWAGWG